MLISDTSDAVLDHPVHNAHRLDLNGESMRRIRKVSPDGQASSIVDMTLRLDKAGRVAHMSTAAIK